LSNDKHLESELAKLKQEIAHTSNTLEEVKQYGENLNYDESSDSEEQMYQRRLI
jgi:hypothetical protein